MADNGGAVYLGVDVGSSSVRAKAVDSDGVYLGDSVVELRVWRPQHEFYEQSSQQIWEAVCCAVVQLTQKLDLEIAKIAGIGFDATCSLVIVSKDGSLGGDDSTDYRRDVIMWMDHRATQETDFINTTKHAMLDIVGGKISPEMQPPKLLWLKRHRPQLFDNAEHFMDLADFLTWKATGSTVRSLCTTVCKWLLNANENERNWSYSFYNDIGLNELPTSGKIGRTYENPGSPIPGGLTAASAAQLGLVTETPVAVGIIDAHAGVIGAMSTTLPAELEVKTGDQLIMICGTSTCHMALTDQVRLVPGVWGPYFEAILPGLYLNEAGQSAVAPIIDMVLRQHNSDADSGGMCQHVTALRDRLGALPLCELAKGTHVWPDYHGNRSPLADSTMTGGIVGLTLQENSDAVDATAVYLAHIFSFAYMTRWIVERLSESGYHFTSIYMCGGLAKNSIYVQTHADVLGLPVVVPDCDQTVALGAAVLGAFASGCFTSLQSTMQRLDPKGHVIQPNKDVIQFHEARYKLFRQFGELIQRAKDI